MRVLVVGAGAIGMLVAGELALAGHAITLVARPALAETLRQQGLHVTGIHGARLTHDLTLVPTVSAAAPHATHNPQPAPSAAAYSALSTQHSALPYDWLALTVKAYDVPGAAEEICAAFVTPPPIVTFQNGVGSEEAVQQTLPGASIIAVSVTIPVTVPAPGQVEARRKGGMAVAPVQPPTADRRSPTKKDRVETFAVEVETTLAGSGFVTRGYADYRAMKWSKLLGNMMGNATSAILDMPPDEIYADPQLFDLEMRALREALAVMRAYDIPAVDLPGLRIGALAWALRLAPSSLLQPILRRVVAGGRGGKMPSLHLDLSAGKGKSEVEYLNGAVVKWGREKGIPTPVNCLLTETLVDLTLGRSQWGEYRRQPERLLA